MAGVSGMTFREYPIGTRQLAAKLSKELGIPAANVWRAKDVVRRGRRGIARSL